MRSEENTSKAEASEGGLVTQVTFNYAYLSDLIQTLHWEGKQLG